MSIQARCGSIGIRLNNRRYLGHLKSLIAELDLVESPDVEVDSLISLRLGGETSRGRKEFHLLYIGATLVLRTLELSEMFDYLKVTLPQLACSEDENGNTRRFTRRSFMKKWGVVAAMVPLMPAFFLSVPAAAEDSSQLLNEELIDEICIIYSGHDGNFNDFNEYLLSEGVHLYEDFDKIDCGRGITNLLYYSLVNPVGHQAAALGMITYLGIEMNDRGEFRWDRLLNSRDPAMKRSMSFLEILDAKVVSCEGSEDGRVLRRMRGLLRTIMNSENEEIREYLLGNWLSRGDGKMLEISKGQTAMDVVLSHQGDKYAGRLDRQGDRYIGFKYETNRETFRGRYVNEGRVSSRAELWFENEIWTKKE